MKKVNVLPDDLNEAVDLLRTFYSKHLMDIMNMSEAEFRSSTHFGAGMFIRNSWNLWWSIDSGSDKPKLVNWFNSIGIAHPDDMSSIILTCLHRNLTDEEYDLDAQVEHYKAHWREQGYPDGIPKQK